MNGESWTARGLVPMCAGQNTGMPMSLQTRDEQVVKTRQHYVTYDPEMLMRCLVEQVLPGPALPQANVLRRTTEGIEEVLFELDIDGTHFLLTRSRPPPSTEHVRLSPRELAIAQLVTKGLPNKTIGEILDISQWTVATHLRRIFVKLDVTSRAAMVARVLADNLL
jgi:two-component system, NarL family, nitrate/nitrite response regulator NarL